MTCPLCGTRRARRSCPALGQQICPVCCATKRLVEVRCPSSCVHLVAGREHPAAAVKRQHEADLRALMATLGRLSEGQMQVFFLIQSYFLRPSQTGAPRPLDAEVADAAGALAATFETASRGLVFEHPARTASGQRMAAELREVLADVGKGGALASSARWWRCCGQWSAGRAPRPKPRPTPASTWVSSRECCARARRRSRPRPRLRSSFRERRIASAPELGLDGRWPVSHTVSV